MMFEISGIGPQNYLFSGWVAFERGKESGPFALQWPGSNVLGNPEATTGFSGSKAWCRIYFPHPGETLLFNFPDLAVSGEVRGQILLEGGRRKYSNCVARLRS